VKLKFPDLANCRTLEFETCKIRKASGGSRVLDLANSRTRELENQIQNGLWWFSSSRLGQLENSRIGKLTKSKRPLVVLEFSTWPTRELENSYNVSARVSWTSCPAYSTRKKGPAATMPTDCSQKLKNPSPGAHGPSPGMWYIKEPQAPRLQPEAQKYLASRRAIRLPRVARHTVRWGAYMGYWISKIFSR
jgi:hypothetical protein